MDKDKLVEDWGGFCAAPTNIHKLLYPKKLLKNLYSNIVCEIDDYKIMSWLFEDIETNLVSEDELKEIIFISVIGNDGNDVKFVREHGELCECCGWCCQNIKLIQIRPDEVPKIGSLSGIEMYKDNMFTFKTPCIYQKSDNKCKIYNNRPDSCKTFPIGIKNGSLIVQRDINCGFIYNFLVNKVYYMVNKVYYLKQKYE